MSKAGGLVRPEPAEDGSSGSRDGEPSRKQSRGRRRLGPVWTELPGLARVAAALGWHSASWGVRTTARNWRRVARATTDPEEAAALVRDVTRTLDVVGDIARSVSTGTPVPAALVNAGSSLAGISAPDVVTGELVGQVVGDRVEERERRGFSAADFLDEEYVEDSTHARYREVLDRLVPDEARIMASLFADGPQPSIDVHTSRLGGLRRSRPVATGLTMFGARGELDSTERVPAYVATLEREGLLRFSGEPVAAARYPMLEVQPHVLRALGSVRFATVERRSVRLTEFGEEFARACLA